MIGPAIMVTYHNVDDPQIRADHADLLAAFVDERVPLPVVLLDGRILSSGAIVPLRVVAAVVEAWQAQS